MGLFAPSGWRNGGKGANWISGWEGRGTKLKYSRTAQNKCTATERLQEGGGKANWEETPGCGGFSVPTARNWGRVGKEGW